MDEATIALTVMTGFIGAVLIGFLIWGIRSGQFHNVEEAKYQVFRRQKPTDDGRVTQESQKKEEEPDAKP
jgi:nitrogen fixation-related uncharacterized protein